MRRPDAALVFLAVVASGCGDQAPLVGNLATDAGPAGDGDSKGLDTGTGTGTDNTDDTETESASPPVEPPELCPEAALRLAQPVCVHTVDNVETWETIALPSALPDTIRITKYLSPATDAAPMATLFMDANTFTMHFDLLAQGFPDLYPGLSPTEYLALITAPGARTFFGGSIFERFPGESPAFGFTVIDDAAAGDGTIGFDEITRLFEDLSNNFKIGDLAFFPETSAQINAARLWKADFPVAGVESHIEYEAYTVGEGFGRLRILSPTELTAARLEMSFGFKDVLVLDQAPLDIETVVAGVVTGTRQGELSHVNVRSANRGTPNCFVENPRDALAEWEGALVRLACEPGELTVRAADLSEAEMFWEALRPAPIALLPPDLGFEAMVPLLDVPTESAEERLLATTRFGAKGANLATLYQSIDAAFQLTGFVIPFYYYDRFMRTRTWTVDTANGPETMSFQAAIEAFLDDPAFVTDGRVRRERLDALRAAMVTRSLPSGMLSEIESQIASLWPNEPVMLRFRSSSNAEDALEFSGAGLYDSRRGCLDDEIDSDDAGPSLCDADRRHEEPVSNAVLSVWASLWNTAAFEEREWYGIDHLSAEMGILVNTRVKGEQADVVVFSGNPTAEDDRYLVNAQIGSKDVVSAEPGVFPEKSLLTVTDGEVTAIERVRASSETAPGQAVLTDEVLRLLGQAMSRVEALYPVDATPALDRTLLLDTEWKLTAEGELVIKQVRPFLR